MVIYRTADSMGAFISPTVMLGGKELANIGNGRVFVVAIAPGHYVVEMDNKKTGTEVTLRAGSSVYLKVEMVPGVWIGQGKLTQIAPEQGEFEAKKLKLIDPKEIENPSYR